MVNCHIKKYFVSIFAVLLALPVFAQTNWTKHNGPVLKRSAVFPNWKGLAAADAFVMKDSDTLKMWYSGVGWLPNATNCPHVRMGYAFSLDGINWNEFPGNPVLDISADTSQFDADGIETPTVIKDRDAPPGERYKLWYAGRKSLCSPIIDHKIGYAYSPDGIHWTKYSGNPVLSAGDSSSWFNTFVSGPSVIKEGAVYKMWFTAPDLVFNGQPTDGKGNIGYATSSDGIHWTIYPSPVLIAGSANNWDSASNAEPSVIKSGDTYHIFYSALDQWKDEKFQVGYAHSTDGINWTKSKSNPVLKTGTNHQWDRYWASHPTVIFDSNQHKFRMWYTGRDTAIMASLTGYYWDIGCAESIVASTDSSAKILAYPNPTNGMVTVILPYLNEPSTIQLFNLYGQKLSEVNDQPVINLSSNLSDGMYILRIIQHAKAWSVKILKMQ